MRKLSGKYSIDGERVVNTVSGEAIPDDEPVFLLRARDRLAVPALRVYLELCRAFACTAQHNVGVVECLKVFQDFRDKNPQLMKDPGSSLGTPGRTDYGPIGSR